MSEIRPLLAEQRRAADPSASAWVSASAGTGKTQVLTARVLRLLLAGAEPDRLLALTFTKAAAAEMQTRIFETLARWVRADDAELSMELEAIGAPGDTAAKTKARTLFANALESRGGLKVQTLHSFAATLLAAFPIEADVAPGYETLDERSALQMRADVLADKVARAVEADPAFMADLAALSVKSGEFGVEEAIRTLLTKRNAFEATYRTTVDWRAGVRRALGLPGVGEPSEVLAAALVGDAFDWATVREYAAAMRAWGKATGLAAADTLAELLSADSLARAANIDELIDLAFTTKYEVKKPPKRNDAAFAALHERFCERVSLIRDLRNGIELAEVAALHLRIGHALAEDYAAAKNFAGALDYDDLIRKAASLLTMLAAQFVLFKLDQRIEHILVDEGQDTNASQWAIVNAIANEFFAGEGARDEEELGPRTQFAVGDYKQAIFGFQGTNPEEFEKARTEAEQRAHHAGKRFESVDLSISFRSVPAVLGVVDAVIEGAGAAAFGVSDTVPAHDAHRKGEAGEVVLWPPVVGEEDDEEEGGGEGTGWVKPNETILSERIAAQVAEWLRNGELLEARGRPVKPGDILILVRSRGELVPALVAALVKNAVPVAGADRLRLTAPIAVQDMLALARFALQPGDDLSLAALLVSPFIGWTQEQLFGVAFGRQTTLWRALRDAKDRGEAAAVAAEEWLGKVLARADYLAPYEFFESILTELEGRALLLARLGEVARDPIEEVLNQALAYEAANTPSLQGFLAWVDTDEVEVKREAESPRDAVRIMTVHGAKGLQAPIVILADATKSAPKPIKPPLTMPLPGIGDAPLYYGTKSLLSGVSMTAFEGAAQAEAEETMRLLYVAMTRAEDRLYVGGALGKKPRAAKSWHGYIADALVKLGAVEIADPQWEGGVLRYTSGVPAISGPQQDGKTEASPHTLPDWALQLAKPEARPPRPLAPSAGAVDDYAAPPPAPAMLAAARRGKVLHLLFERLGSVQAADRDKFIRCWLERNAPDLDAGAITAEVLKVMTDPVLVDFFSPDALSEAPLSAIVGDTVITGTIDKLIIEPDRVRALDFKTGLRIPADAGEVPSYHARQMAAYRDALGVIFPARRIEVALLYTAGPHLIMLD